MEVRLLNDDELLQSRLCSVVAFHQRRGAEECLQNIAEDKYKAPDWGCFDADGALMAHMLNENAMTWFDGNQVMTGCVGAVSTLPEYRNSGAVRAIFEKLLPEARKNGEVFSYLYPFSHAFYRKFGYELCYSPQRYEIRTSAYHYKKFNGWAKMWKPGDAIAPFIELYNNFAQRYNAAFVRDQILMEEHFTDDPYKTRNFVYMLGDDNGACAYLRFADVKIGDDNAINVLDYAFLGKRGFDALMGFLARFSAEYDKIIVNLPEDIDLFALMKSPYDIKKTAQCNYMARVVNVEKALALMKKPEDAEFVIEVFDDMLPENAGTWLVKGGGVEKTERAPDISLDVRALAQILLGYAPLFTAELRDDVEARGNRALLERLFVKKPIYASDHF